MAKILIAEDEMDIRNLIVFTLELANHEVIATSNGADAWETIQEMAAEDALPDLVLLDVRMPRMTGYEVCQKVNAEESMKDVPVAFLSAKGQDTEVQQGFEVGAVDYIIKPFSPDQLTSKVATLLEKSGG
jgi:DNA-binding response OmpR family regulator